MDVGGMQRCHVLLLSMSGNSIGAEGAVGIGKGLEHCPRLTTLDIRSKEEGGMRRETVGEMEGEE